MLERTMRNEHANNNIESTLINYSNFEMVGTQIRFSAEQRVGFERFRLFFGGCAVMLV